MHHLKKLTSEKIHENPWWSYHHDTLALPSGKQRDYFYAVTTGAALIIPVTEDGRLILVRQYRYLSQRFSLEFPMGRVEPGESPLDGAKRELAEETGLTSQNLVLLGTFEPSNGMLKNLCSVYLAEGVAPGNGQLFDEAEEIETMGRRVDEFEDLIARGEIWDGTTLAAWALGKAAVLNYVQSL